MNPVLRFVALPFALVFVLLMLALLSLLILVRDGPVELADVWRTM